jgi:hypothetical protein
MTDTTPTPLDHDNAAAFSRTVAPLEPWQRERLAELLAAARAEGRREGLDLAADRLRLWASTLEGINPDGIAQVCPLARHDDGPVIESTPNSRPFLSRRDDAR